LGFLEALSPRCLLTLELAHLGSAKELLLERSMSDSELKALAAQVKKLTARVEALERLLERILRQKPVSEKQLEKALRGRGVSPPEISR
jgi:DNA repair ATPase RecN